MKRMAGNVLSWKQARASGFNPQGYGYRSTEVPQGSMEAVLDCKIWGGKVMGIGCYFSRCGDGKKFLVTVYYNRIARNYSIGGSKTDIYSCPLKGVYGVEVGTNGKGHPVLQSVELANTGSDRQG